MLKIAFLFLVVIASALSQCLEPAGVKNFDRAKFSGSWRNHVVVGTSLVTDVIPPCVAFSFTGSTKYDVLLSYVRDGQVGTLSSVEVSSTGGSFIVSDDSGRLAKIVVLDTDYVNYASLYFCAVSNSSRSTVEVFTRSRVRDDHLIEKKLAEAQKIVPITSPRADVDQRNCIN
ncbi:unnamed protein product [Callosobruchus maculatus]|uniref:Uncharacterized protein n=1 Tax=Callosobruchus maculatus TaxID=64391 RepID=A0A653C6J3_CALMS|nr:unnamed protein product [Callosobruchus maculatus]